MSLQYRSCTFSYIFCEKCIMIVFPITCLYGCRNLSFEVSLFPILMSVIILLSGAKNFFSVKTNFYFSVPSIWKRMTLLSVACGIFCLLMEDIGFYADAFLMVFFIYSIIDTSPLSRRIPYACLASLLVTAGMYLFFYYGLQVMTPQGEWFDRGLFL